MSPNSAFLRGFMRGVARKRHPRSCSTLPVAEDLHLAFAEYVAVHVTFRGEAMATSMGDAVTFWVSGASIADRRPFRASQPSSRSPAGCYAIRWIIAAPT
jgi:hypothetical protein